MKIYVGYTKEQIEWIRKHALRHGLKISARRKRRLLPKSNLKVSPYPINQRRRKSEYHTIYSLKTKGG
jgi:hypothetical protein